MFKYFAKLCSFYIWFRFYDVKDGSVELDGCDIKKLDPSWLRRRVLGLISQEPVLFGTSIMENIRYGKHEATDEEVNNVQSCQKIKSNKLVFFFCRFDRLLYLHMLMNLYQIFQKVITP